jgi:hypothetical protein
MGASPSKTSKSEQDYRAEDDFRTMQRAAEVTTDKARHDRALAHGRKQVATMTKVMGGLRGKARKGTRAARRA